MGGLGKGRLDGPIPPTRLRMGITHGGRTKRDPTERGPTKRGPAKSGLSGLSNAVTRQYTLQERSEAWIGAVPTAPPGQCGPSYGRLRPFKDLQQAFTLVTGGAI